MLWSGYTANLTSWRMGRILSPIGWFGGKCPDNAVVDFGVATLSWTEMDLSTRPIGHHISCVSDTARWYPRHS